MALIAGKWDEYCSGCVYLVTSRAGAVSCGASKLRSVKTIRTQCPDRLEKGEAVKTFWQDPPKIGAGAAECPKCREAEALANSDATTPGFIHKRCQEHRTEPK